MNTKSNNFGSYSTIFLILMLVLMITCCHSTKEIHQQRVIGKIDAVETENIQSETAVAIITDTKTMAETIVTESFDTIISILPIVDGVVADEPISFPVKGTRTIHRKELSDQKQTSKEKGTVVANRKEQMFSKTDVQKKERQVKRVWIPGWFVLSIVAVAVGAGVWFLWRKRC
jgi:hypothetical protein